MSVWRHIRAVALLPAMVTSVIPAVLVLTTGVTNVGWGLPSGVAVLPVLGGAALLALGLGLIATTAMLLASIGKGTLAPWDPTSRLVVRGPYRHVRNPMISGVLSILVAEAAILGSWPVLAWSALFLAINVVWLPLHEEPRMVKRFGPDYERYRSNVRAWLPSRRAWTQPTE